MYILLTDGIGAPDFGESLRFQKVLQGQEILGFDGMGTQNLHPSETGRSYPGSNSSGIPAMGTIGRNLHVSSDNISCKGIGFGESLRFHKVLQGQEIHPNSPCGKAPTKNEASQYGGQGIIDGVQVPSSRNGWSTLMQGNSTHVRSSAQSMQVSSPSSVLMFQHALGPVSNLNSIYNGHNQEEQRIAKRSSYMTESNGGNLTLSSICNHSSRSQDHGGGKSPSWLTDNNQHGISNPCSAQSAYSKNQDVVSSCKSSCRLFGFSLTEDKHVPDKEASSKPDTTLLHPGDSLFPNVGGQPPIMTNTVRSNCTKVSKPLCF